MATKKKQQGFDQQSHLLKTLLREIAKVQVPEVAVLSEEERTRVARWRGDFEKEVPLVHDLAKKYGVKVPTHDLEQAKADIAFADELEPIRGQIASALVVLQQGMDDTILLRRSRAWQAFLAYYGMLATMAEHDPALAAELKPIVVFLSNRSRSNTAGNEDKEPAKLKESNG